MPRSPAWLHRPRAGSRRRIETSRAVDDVSRHGPGLSGNRMPEAYQPVPLARRPLGMAWPLLSLVWQIKTRLRPRGGGRPCVKHVALCISSTTTPNALRLEIRSTAHVQRPRTAMIIRSRNWKRRYAQAPSTDSPSARPDAPPDRRTVTPDGDQSPAPPRDANQTPAQPPLADERDESR